MNESGLDQMLVLYSTVVMGAMAFGFLLFIYLYQRKIMDKQRKFREIENLLQQSEMKATYAAIEGQDNERKRIAQDIHDNLGSLLATVAMLSGSLADKVKEDDLKTITHRLSEISSEAMDATRRISHALDVSTLQRFGLRSGLIQLCEAVNLSGKVKVKTDFDQFEDPPQEIGLQVYRITQELFTNALKHSAAKLITLHVSEVPGQHITIIFEDNGRGIDPKANMGMGLQGIRNRVEKYLGEFVIESSPGKGTSATVEFPLKQSEVYA